jgi:hypothetical protein
MLDLRPSRVAGVIAAVGLSAGLMAAAPGAASASSPAAKSQTHAGRFVSFAAFIKATSDARYGSYVGAGLPGHARSRRAFDVMRSYILATYRDVKVEHSFVLDGGYFDCVTTHSQPTVRDLGIHVIAQPPAATHSAHHGGRALVSPLTLGRRDAYGNAISCPAGTIPMRRISLGEMTRFPTLAAYLAKQPGGGGTPQTTPGGPHRYAYGIQNLTNYGGNSWLNVWNPSGEFSLSQQWYTNGTGAGLQTVEGGWVHYPDQFGANSVLFIYSTPNNYTSGCYNLMCAGFVQTSAAVALGGPFTNYSSYGGTQWGFALQWKYFAGNWWMFYQGSAVGYYPGKVFNRGPMATNASATLYGGETYTAGNNWPQMGSGKFASAGWSQAAFQNTIFYIPRDENGGTGVWSALTTTATNPACYTINYTGSATGGSWGTYFYFGGPGGVC